jgi:hypothetical protein
MVLVHLHLEDFLFVSVHEITSGHSTGRFWGTYCRLNKTLQNVSSPKCLEANLSTSKPFGSQNALIPKPFVVNFSRWIKGTLCNFWVSTGGLRHIMPSQNESPPKSLGAKPITSKPNSCHKSMASRTFGLLVLQVNEYNKLLTWFFSLHTDKKKRKFYSKFKEIHSYMTKIFAHFRI